MRHLDLGAAALVFSALLACAGASHHQLSPDTYSIDCKRSASNCYAEATTVCPNGFDVLDAQGQQGAIATSHTYGQTTNTQVVPTYSGEMLVRCRTTSPAAAPSAVATTVLTAEPRPVASQMLP